MRNDVMRNIINAPLFLALAAVSTTPANGCGRDYFLCDPASLPDCGALLLPTFKWDHEDGENEFEFSTGYVRQFLPRVAFDGYFSFADEGEGWEMEAVVPGLLFDLTPESMKDSDFRLGLFAAYKFAVNGGEEDEGFISANQLDARDQFETRVIVETDVTDEFGFVFNLLNTLYDGEVRWGYAVGARYEFTNDIGGSIEAIGDFRADGKHQVFASAWWEPSPGVVLRLGAGAGLSEKAEDFTLLSGLVYEF